ncbi:MAG: energy transducer TonB [Aquificaceae bacterium]
MLEEKLENSLYWGVSLVLNLIIFTLLSLYLSVRIEVKNPTKPMEVYLQEMPEIKEVKLASGRGTPNLRQQTGEGIVRKDRHLVSSSPMEVSRSTGDLQVPAGRPKEEPSLLQEIEQRVRGREREIEKEGVRSADIGDITAVVSPGGVGLSGGGRAAVYIPPFPKISSDEPLSPLRVRIWIDPSGVVSRVQIIQKSGSPQVDQKMVEFVRGIRFEAIRENVVQTGVITFRFKGG